MNLNRLQLERLLPHRPPILILDRIIDLVPGQRGTGVKHFGVGNPFFAGHFPDRPMLPGIYTIEALAQTAATIFLVSDKGVHAQPLSCLLAKVDEMAFYAPIVPGDEVEFRVEIDRTVGLFVFVRGEAAVKDKRCAAGKLTLRMEQ